MLVLSGENPWAKLAAFPIEKVTEYASLTMGLNVFNYSNEGIVKNYIVGI